MSNRRSTMEAAKRVLVLFCAVALLALWHGTSAQAQADFELRALGPEQTNADLQAEFGPGVCDAFVPLGVYELRITISGLPLLTAMGVELTIPDGWGFRTIAGDCPPDIQQIEATDNLLELAWTSTPPSFLPCQFTVLFNAPVSASVDQVFGLKALYRVVDESDLFESEEVFLVVVEGGPCIGGVACAPASGRGIPCGDGLTAALCLMVMLAGGWKLRLQY